ncbi:MAG: hypothetical protein IT244_05795, partial [Bacteroidia bacterium]|nr:hypothetical protein [Bacteroidia bacterium]
MRTFLLISSIFVFQISQAQSKLNLYPNYNTIGITVLLNTGVSDSAYGNCFYRIKENGNWQPWKTGFELARTTNKQYGGCVFHTTPGKEYMVRTVLKLGQTVVSDLIDSTTTRPEIENKTALRTFYVSPNGSGVSQTRNTPGTLNQSLLNQLKAGDHVILLEGEYFTGELNITQSGTASQPIVLQAENDKVIVNGGFKQPIQWKRAQSDTAHRDYNMFYADLGPINSNCVVVNGKRLYPYRNLMELSYFSSVRIIDNSGSGSGFHGINHDGFFRDGRNSTSSHFPFIDYNPNTYIKFKDKSDTAFKSIQVSQQAWAFSIQSQNYITIKGIHFKYFGAAKQINYRCAIFLNNANNIIVDSCSFDFCDKGIYIRANSNNNTIQHCQFEDDFSKLSYFEFKETGLEYGQLNTYYPNYFPFQARNIEPGRVYFDHLFTGRGNVLRYNFFNGGCDGITCPDTPGDTTRSRHFDIHNNIFGPGSDDAFEVDGNAANIRVWGNEMYGAANGISVSSPCYGPVYIFNNVMRHFRKTVFQYVTNVVVMNTDTIPASPLKLNAAFCDIPGKVYFMHNTVDAGKESYGFV